MRGILSNRRFWAAAIVSVALVALMGATRTGVGRLQPVQVALSEMLAPIETVTGGVAGRLAGTVSFVRGIFTLDATNARLRTEVAALRTEVSQDALLRQDNVRLRGLLALRSLMVRIDPGGGAGLAAQVVAESPDTWFKSVVVDKGSGDGVRQGMVAVAPAGLVGRVTAVSPHTATVTLITDPDSGVGAMVQRASSRAVGVVSGQMGSADLSMQFFAPHPSVQPGDAIVTSGLGGLFPQGIPVGTVTRVGPGDFGLVETAVVRPDVALARLEFVLLIRPPATGSA